MGRVLQLAVVQDRHVLVRGFEMLDIVWDPWADHVVGYHNSPLRDQPILLQELEVFEVHILPVVQENNIQRSYFLHLLNILLDITFELNHFVLESSPGEDFTSHLYCVLVDFQGVDFGLWDYESREEDRGVPAICSDLQDCFGLDLLELISYNDSLLRAQIHHPVLPAEIVNLLINTHRIILFRMRFNVFPEFLLNPLNVIRSLFPLHSPCLRLVLIAFTKEWLNDSIST